MRKFRIVKSRDPEYSCGYLIITDRQEWSCDLQNESMPMPELKNWTLCKSCYEKDKTIDLLCEEI
jgi:hypothetical protein